MSYNEFIGYEYFNAHGPHGDVRISVSRYDTGYTVLTFGPATAGFSIHLEPEDARTLFRKLGVAIGADPSEVYGVFVPNELAEAYADSELA